MLSWLTLVSLVVVVIAMAGLTRGNRKIRFLRDVPDALPARPPRVSLIVAACNEQRNIAAALDSLLAQDYPDYEIIVVDDRSSDATPAIITDRASRDARMKVMRIDELPAGWLGKNHALDSGACLATGEFLIFADADVVMRSGAIRRAVAHAVAARRDHIALAPAVIAPSPALGMVIGVFTLFFSLYARAWNASNPDSRCFIGIGAFNLVRADTYRALGGHRRIAMRPDDDIRLGEIIKKAGYSQEMLFGHDLVCLEWYPSLAALARGFEKNTLAGVNYHVSAIIAATFALVLCFVWPFAALVCTSGWTLAANAAICAVLAASYLDQARLLGMPRWHAIGLPFAITFFIWVLLRASFITLRNRGINWRGTHYSLAALKAGRH
jgi:glycosyltransferase involved in cell wall biosynthesis